MNATATMIRTIWAVALLATVPVCAQVSPAPSTDGPVHLTLASTAVPAESAALETEASNPLPDAPLPAPGFPLSSIGLMPDDFEVTFPAPPPPLLPCPKRMTADTPRCLVNPFQRFLDSRAPLPLTPGQKGYLALRNFIDPANIITITGIAAITVGFNADTAYGPGLKGFGRDTAYSFSQDATGEFFGTFLIPSMTHEDPHYHREPHAPVGHRLLHALSRTLIAQSDTGHLMPNYAVLLTYPISAETSNLYVPGTAVNAASTTKRILTGLATDPVNNLITEFLPDVARRINIRVIFVQRIVNVMTAGNMGGEAVAP